MGYLRVRFISKRLRDLFIYFNPNHIIISLSLYFFFLKESDFLIVLYFLAMLADKNQVAPRLSFSNVAALNFLLRSEIFVSEDRQLQATHLILEFDSISKILQESDFLIVLYFLAMLADKNQVVPRLSFSNVVALNFLLRLKIFVSEDGQLRAVHLILDFDPISKILQEVDMPSE